LLAYCLAFVKRHRHTALTFLQGPAIIPGNAAALQGHRIRAQ